MTNNTPTWTPIESLPAQQPNEDQIPCVLVWQDSEHENDQGVEITHLEALREGLHNHQRLSHAYFKTLEGSLNTPPTHGWKTVANLLEEPTPTEEDENEDEDNRCIVVWKEEDTIRREESCLAYIREGDFPPHAHWLSLMDAPALKPQ